MSILGDLQLIIIAILGAIASGAYFVGGWRGRKAERKDRELEELNRHIATGKALDQVLRENDGASDADIDERLRKYAKRKP